MAANIQKLARLDAIEHPQYLRNERSEVYELAVGCSNDDDRQANPLQVLLVRDALVHREHRGKPFAGGLTKERAVLQGTPTHLANAPSIVPGQLSGELPGQVLIE